MVQLNILTKDLDEAILDMTGDDDEMKRKVKKVKQEAK